jgi:hypothetical protein
MESLSWLKDSISITIWRKYGEGDIIMPVSYTLMK